MDLYVYEGYKGGRSGRRETEELAALAAQLFLEKKYGHSGPISYRIRRMPGGKPYFQDIPLEFSVSHTGSLWVCLIADGTAPVGVDIQAVRSCRRDSIAARYYTEDEQEYVRRTGEDGFFQIWTRKEAYVKYTGEGLSRQLASFSTLQDSAVEFIDFQLCSGVKGSCCVKEKSELWIKTIK